MIESLTAIVARWRTENGLTQSEAAARIGTTQANFSRIENGARFPDKGTAKLFVDAGVFTAEQLGRALVASVPDDEGAAA